jgi:tetratricopeptide (TPR) repeat protein
MTYNKINIAGGWFTFILATIVYISTIEPTASFWDCGEFIATAYKLQVGHPAGAPFFMLIARVFGAFVAVENVAYSVNLISGLASSFTILFLFWSITHLVKKLSLKTGDLTEGKILAIIFSGFIGSMAFAFSDSFWFSAVEGEVYAMSSLFTAVVLWAILKWESVADEPHNLRWIVLIAYLMGLSIGVHLLNLLAIPAICFVYYFKKYQITTAGIIKTAIVSVVTLGAIQAGIIPGVVKLAGSFELLFVNSFGLPFNSGVLAYAIILVALVCFGLLWTRKNNKAVYNTVIVSFAVILIGYSTYALVVIRSSANPVIDENNPENVFNLLSYLNREQYGERPLLYGQYFNAPLDSRNPYSDGEPVRMKAYTVKSSTGSKIKVFNNFFSANKFIDKSKTSGYKIVKEYIVSDDRKGSVYNYDDNFQTIFPRMYSAQPNHIGEYKRWSDFKGKPIKTTGNDGKPTTLYKPTMGENLTFFFRFQLNWAYWRYFMWNYAGRQNDIQGHSGMLDGNWLSGVDLIDQERLGPQNNLPSSMKENKGYNKFYMFPLLLGIIGLFYQLYRSSQDWWVVMLLFFLTGVAIILYLNPTPLQPRERDYAYTGSFYAFALWIGIGVYAIFDASRTLTMQNFKKIFGLAAIAAVFIFFAELIGSGEHYFSYSIIYLSIISIVVLGIMHLLGKSVKNDLVMAILALVICSSVPGLMAANGWDDHTRAKRYTGTDFAKNYLNSCEKNAVLFTNGDNDTFPLWYVQEVEGFRTDVRIVNLSLLNTDWYIDQMKRKAYDSEPVEFSLEEDKYRQGTRDIVLLDASKNPRGVFVDIAQAIQFVNDDNNRTQVGMDKYLNYIPTKTFAIKVDKNKVLKNGTASIADTAKIVDEIQWSINKSYVQKNELMMMDLLANFNWDRPIYYAVTTGPDSYLNLQDYFSLEGLAYRLVPIKSPKNPNPNLSGKVNADVMYDNLMNKFFWGNMDGKDELYMDENNLRMTTNLRLQVSNLADQLIREGKKDKAKKILDKSLEVMPERNVPYTRIMLPLVENYYKLGENEKANKLNKRLFDIFEEEMNYYLSLDQKWAARVSDDMQMSMMVTQRLQMYATQMYPQKQLGDELTKRFEILEKTYQEKMQEIETGKRRSTVKATF